MKTAIRQPAGSQWRKTLVVLVVGAMAGCSGGSPMNSDGDGNGNGNGNGGGNGSEGSFSITLSTSSVTLQQGTGETIDITVARVGDFDGTVTLAASGVPAGGTVDFSPAEVVGSFGTLRVDAGLGLAPGSYQITIEGTAQGVPSASVALNLMVELAPDLNYEIKFDVQNASGWYGGDNRDCCGPRTVGIAQEVLVDAAILLERFSFFFTDPFQLSQDPAGPTAVSLALDVRGSDGSLIDSFEIEVPDSFDGGWVTWDELGVEVAAGTTLIFSSYQTEAYDTNPVNTGYSADQDAGYSDGVSYTKGGESNEDMAAWEDWYQHAWDANFWLQGVAMP